MEAAQSSIPPLPSPPPPPSSPPWPPPQLPDKRTVRRYGLAWRVLMIANLGLGAYMFLKGKHKDIGLKGSKRGPEPAPPTVTENTHPLNVNVESQIEAAPIAAIQPVKVQKTIAIDQQRELFRWVLEEKRKVKPRNQGEKKRMDEDKVQKVAHEGCVNRIRSMPQNPHICASWGDTGYVQVWDFSSHLKFLGESQTDVSQGTATVLNQAALTVFKHKDEGYAIDWSPVVPGRLVSGDCKNCIHLWEPSSGATWNVDSSPFIGHTGSVEDLLVYSAINNQFFLYGIS